MKVQPSQQVSAPEQQQVIPRVQNRTQEESRRLIQRQLVLLLHAHNCQRKDNAAASAASARSNDSQNGARSNDSQNGAQIPAKLCPIPHCQTMKGVWVHMRTCTVGPDCSFLHCASSLKILAHWKHCTTWNCPVCHLIRLKGSQNAGAGAKPGDTAGVHPPMSGQTRFHAKHLIISTSANNSSGNEPDTSHTSSLCNRVSSQAYHDRGVPDYHNSHDGCHLPQQPQQQQCNIDTSAPIQHHIINNRGGNQFRVPTAMDVRKAYEQLGIPCPPDALERLMATLPGGSSPKSGSSIDSGHSDSMDDCGGDPPDDVPFIADEAEAKPNEAEAGAQEWRQSMSSLNREQLVHKIREATFPTTTLSIPQGNDMMLNLVSFSRKLEMDVYHSARTVAEYYELITKRIDESCRDIAGMCLRRQQQRLIETREFNVNQPHLFPHSSSLDPNLLLIPSRDEDEFPRLQNALMQTFRSSTEEERTEKMNDP